MRIRPILALAGGMFLPACALYFEQDPGNDPAAPACELRSADGATPGYPFDVSYFEELVWPLTQRTCGSAGCHDARDGFTRDFEVWSQDDPCSPLWSFNELYDHSDFIIFPGNSDVLAALGGSMPGHPTLAGPDSAEYRALYRYIEDAWLRYIGAPRPSVYFDFVRFQNDIQPRLDDASCTAPGCHDIYSGASWFALHDRPAWDSAEMYDNFEIVTGYADLTVWPEQTRLFIEATNWHGGTVVDDSSTLLDWITDAFDRVNGVAD